MIIDNMLKWKARGESVLPLQVDFSHFMGYVQCPRFWLYRYILGLQPDEWWPSMDLVCGSAWHAGLEAGYQQLQHDPQTPIERLKEISIIAADSCWQEKSRGMFGEDETWPKSLNAVKRNLAAYWDYYAGTHANQEVVGVEMPFSIPINTGLPLLYGTIDLVSREPSGEIVVTEHKTAKSFSKTWQRVWDNSFQLEAYATALYLYFGRIPRVCVSGSLFNKTYGAQFTRLWYRFGPKKLNRFYAELIRHMNQLHYDTELMLQEIESGSDIMSAFPRQQGNCHLFRTCQFYDFCPYDVWPLKWDGNPPAGWEINSETPLYKRETGGNEDAEKGSDAAIAPRP